MKAIQLSAFGGPDVLHLVDVPEPHPGKGQVRVRLAAIGVNPFDAKVRSGMMEMVFKTPLPAILGNEIAGTVDEVGEGVTGLKKGDEVFGWSDSHSYAELAVATLVVLKPKSLSWPLAAALPVAAETASRVLGLLQVKKGETLLIHGGAGAVGSMGVQLAVQRGVTVIATGSAANQALLKSYGAIPLVYGEGLVGRVRALGKRIDAVFDAAGKGAIPDSIEIMGGNTQRIITIADPAAMKLGVTFSSGGAKDLNTDVLKTVGELAAGNALKVEIAQTFALADAAKAHAQLETNHKPGKLVLVP